VLPVAGFSMIVTQKGKAERLVIFGSACLLAGVILTSLIPFELRQALWHWNQLCLLQIGVLLETLFLATALGIRAQQTALSLYQSEQARSRLSRDLHDDLGSTLSSIALNSTLAGTLDSPDKMRETLRRISQEAREASANVKDLIWAMYPGSNSTAEVLARMRQFAQNTLDPQGIEYRFDVGEGVENLQLDMESRRHLYLIFKEAVNNAAKYAKSTSQLIFILSCFTHINNSFMSLFINFIFIDELFTFYLRIWTISNNGFSASYISSTY
jgi:signal transduction histidine kinase